MSKSPQSTTEPTPKGSRKLNINSEKPNTSEDLKPAADAAKEVNTSPARPKELGPKNSTIDQYFTHIVKTQPPTHPPERQRPISINPPTAWSPLKENAVYAQLRISEIKSGPGRIRFSGRIVNLTEHELKAQKLPGASKERWILAVADGSGILEVRLYLRDPQHLHVRPALGGLVSVHATFIGRLSPEDKEKGNASTGDVFVSISDTDKDSNVEFMEDSDDNYADYRVPLGVKVGGGLPALIPLRVFVEGSDENPDAKILVGIKWKGPRKIITRADSSGSFRKRDIGIFDDTMECTMSLFGSMEESARTWSVGDTVLLIEKPRLNIHQQIVEIRLRKSSIVTIDPLIREATYLRSYVAALIRKNNIAQPFPDESFDIEETLNAEEVWKYTLGDIDRYSRDAEINELLIGSCTGILNAVITEMNMTSLWNKNMLFCKSCCGVVHYSSKLPATCERCDKEHYDMVLNPGTIGRISDETGSITGRNLLVSQNAWKELLGVPVSELWRKEKPYFQTVDAHCLYLRRNFVFGWKAEIGKFAIMGIKRA